MSDSATCGVSRTEGRPPGGSPRFCSKAPDAPELGQPPSKQAAKQPQQTLLLEENPDRTTKLLPFGKSATWGKKGKRGNKECREVAARRNPSSTVPRSIIPHSPNPASSATTSPSAPNIAPDQDQDQDQDQLTKSESLNHPALTQSCFLGHNLSVCSTSSSKHCPRQTG